MSSKLCVYHGKCVDGFTAAWVVKHKFGDDVQMIEGVHGEDPSAFLTKFGSEKRDVIIVDFSYDYETMKDIADASKSLTILDHHISAKDAIERLFADGDAVGIFDNERSGAGITWDYYFDSRSRPELVDYVEDRDLWRFDLIGSQEYNSYVFAHEYTFDNWDKLNDTHPTNCIERGESILRKHQKDIKELIETNSYRMVIAGFDIPCLNVPYTHVSEAGNIMTQGEPFAVCYFDYAEGRQFSLRSTDEGEDVSIIAKHFGGGGHRNASAFRIPFEKYDEFHEIQGDSI